MSCFILHVLFSRFYCSEFLSLVIASTLQFWCIDMMVMMIKIMIKSALVFHAYLDIVICHWFTHAVFLTCGVDLHRWDLHVHDEIYKRGPHCPGKDDCYWRMLLPESTHSQDHQIYRWASSFVVVYDTLLSSTEKLPWGRETVCLKAGETRTNDLPHSPISFNP